MNQNLTSFKVFFPEACFLSCFSGSDWMMISPVNVKTNFFWRGERKDNVCYRLSYQMYNSKLSHVNSPLNVWGVAVWQHTSFTKAVYRTLWNIKSNRIAVFLKTHLCENKINLTLVGFPCIFSFVFVWARRRRATVRSWHLDSLYPILVAECYLPQSWHFSKLTMLNQKSIF